MAATMKDVAVRANVSLTTVSLVLNKPHLRSIPQETRERVLDAIRALKYQPNIHARRLASRRSNTMGMIVSEISNPFFGDVIRAFEMAAAKRGLDQILCNTEYEPARIEAAVQRMIMEKARGVAVMTSTFDEESVSELARNRIHVVLLNPGPDQMRVRRIQIDYASGVTEAVDHLLELGHRVYGVISGPLRSRAAARMREITLAVLSRKGIGCSRLVESDYKAEAGAFAVRSILSQPPVPTAFLCGNDLIALGAISAFQDAGVRVPEDVSVVGADDVFFAPLARPPLTTVAVPCGKLGTMALEVLESMNRSRPPTPESLTLETHLVIRKSTAPPATRVQQSARL
jgi:DNA-binding LacI/PurR family transcriptional regulator